MRRDLILTSAGVVLAVVALVIGLGLAYQWNSSKRASDLLFKHSLGTLIALGAISVCLLLATVLLSARERSTGAVDIAAATTGILGKIAGIIALGLLLLIAIAMTIAGICGGMYKGL